MLRNHTILKIGVLFLGLLAFNAAEANRHHATITNNTDTDLIFNVSCPTCSGEYLIPHNSTHDFGTWRDDHGWLTINTINGKPIDTTIYSYTAPIIDRTTQVYTISQGNKYGMDFTSVSNRIAYDQDNLIAKSHQANAVIANELKAITENDTQTILHRKAETNNEFDQLLAKDMSETLQAHKLASGQKTYQVALDQQRLKDTDSYYLSDFSTIQLGKYQAVRLRASQNKVIDCGARINDGNAYLLLDEPSKKFSALTLMAANNSHTPLTLSILPMDIPVGAGTMNYCIVDRIGVE